MQWRHSSKVLGNDSIALEAKYHKHCLAETFTKVRRMQKKPSEDNEATALDTAFDNLNSEIEPDFLQGAAFDPNFLLSQ